MNDIPWADRDTRSLTKYMANLKGHYAQVVSVEPRTHLKRHTVLEITVVGQPIRWRTWDILRKQAASLMARHTDWEQRIGCFIHPDGRSCSVDIIWEDPCKS